MVNQWQRLPRKVVESLFGGIQNPTGQGTGPPALAGIDLNKVGLDNLHCFCPASPGPWLWTATGRSAPAWDRCW